MSLSSAATAAAAPPPRPPDVIPRDFPDRMSPILVKELRQGLRQPTFLIAYLCLQVLLCIVVLVAALGSSSGDYGRSGAGSAVSGFFFTLVGITLLAAQPLRALNSLASEIKMDTLDLLMLSRLSAWRITFGKWLALVSQSALLVVAVLPYLILRYYLGGMKLFPELFWLGYMFVLSACLTAVMVGFSASASMLLRGLVGTGYVVLLFMAMQGVGRMLTFGMSGMGSPGFSVPVTASDWKAWGAITLTLGYIGYYVLEMGATCIAPAAENRTTLKRLVGVLALILVAWLAPPVGVVRAACWLAIATFLIIDAVSERPDFAPMVLQPFRRLGWFYRPARMLLLPGWPSGLLFAAVLCVATVAMAATEMLHDPSGPGSVRTPSFCAFVCVWLSCLLMPAAVRVWCLGRMASPFAAYVVALFGMLVVGLVLLIIGEATNLDDAFFWAMPVCPFCGFVVLSKSHRIAGADVVCIWAGFIGSIYWALAFLRSIPHYRRVAEMDLVAAAKLAVRDEPVPSPDPSANG